MKKYIYLAFIASLQLSNARAQSVPTLAADLQTGVGGSNCSGLTTLGTDLYLHESGNTVNRIWKYATATGAVTDVSNTAITTQITDWAPMVVAGGKVFYSASALLPDPSGFGLTLTGPFLWQYTPGGGTIPYTDTGTSMFVDNSAVVGGKTYFLGSSLSPAIIGTGSEVLNGLFYFDATGVVHLAHDFALDNIASEQIISCDQLVAANNKLYFTLTTWATPSVYQELCSYDPATSTTTVINYFSLAGVESPSMSSLYAGNDNNIYYSATTTADGRELYQYKPATNTTTKLTSLNASSDGLSTYGGLSIPYSIMPSAQLATLGGYIYFAGCDGLHGFDLMRLKLADNTTSLVKDINPSTNSSHPIEFILFNSKLYFSADDGTHGRELWVTDGTTTTMVADTNPGTGDSNPHYFAISNGILYFDADNGTSGAELYKLGATSSGSGVAAVSQVNDVSVYPNPAGNQFNVSIDMKNDATITFKLTDVTGKQLYASQPHDCKAGVSLITVPFKEYAAGIYQYTVYSSNGAMIASGKVSHN